MDDDDARRAWRDAAYEWGEAHSMTALDVILAQAFCRQVDADPERAAIWSALQHHRECLSMYPPDPSAPIEIVPTSSEVERRLQRD